MKAMKRILSLMLSLILVAGMLPMTAEAAPSKYTITFDVGDGNVTPQSAETKGNGKLSTLPTPSKTGYTFDAWYNDNNKVDADTVYTADTTLIARWIANTYTVSFVANGGTGEMDDQTFTYDKEDTLTANAFTSTGYTFAGWKDADGNVYEDKAAVKNLTAVNNGVITLYAQWTAIEYNIGYELDGGSVEGNPATYTIETETFTLNNPTKTGHTFLGWTGSNGTEPETDVTVRKGSTGEKNYVAKWQANTPTIVTISQVSVRFRAPVAGQPAETVFSVDEPTDQVNCSLTVKADGEAVTAFEAGHTYNCEAILTPVSGYQFLEPFSMRTVQADTQNAREIAVTPESTERIVITWVCDTPPVRYEVDVTDGAARINGEGDPVTSAQQGAILVLSHDASKTPANKEFKGWTSDDVVISNEEGRFSFTMPGNNVAVTPVYADVTPPAPTEYDIIVNGGVAKVNGKTVTKAAEGATVTLTANAALEGEEFDKWTSDDVNITDDSFIMPPQEVNIDAVWKNKCTCTEKCENKNENCLVCSDDYNQCKGVNNSVEVSITACDGSTVVGEDDGAIESPFTVNKGESFVFKVNIAEGYKKNTEFAVLITGSEYTEAEGVYTIANIQNDVTITVTGVEKKTYVVTYYKNDGTEAFETDTKTHGEDLTLKSPSDRNDYIFKGWNTAEDGNGISYEAGTKYTADAAVTLYAQWEAEVDTPVEYKIIDGADGEYQLGGNANGLSFTANGEFEDFIGVKVNNENLAEDNYAAEEGSTVVTLKKFYLENLEPGQYSLTILFGDGQASTQFKIKAAAYTVSFVAGEGSGEMTSVTGISGEYVLPECTFEAPAGKEFKAWRVGDEEKRPGEKITVSAATTVTALWKDIPAPTTYTVSFAAGEGSGEMTSVTGVSGEYVLPECTFEAPEGQEFKAWSVGGEEKQPGDKITVSSNVEVIAVWENVSPVAYEIIFKFADNVTDDESKFTGTDGKLTELPTPERTGYEFEGWYNGTTKVDINTVYNVATTLTAKWEANTYTVSFDANDGKGTMNTQTFTYDVEQKLTANAFTRTGYTFAGWETESGILLGLVEIENPVKNLTAVNDGNVTLYAKWKANTYTVSFAANGGTGTMADQTFTYDGEKALTANAFTRTGYTFAGWKNAGGTAYADKATVKNLTAVNGGKITLTAQWTKNADAPATYTVRYDANGGRKAPAAQTKTHGVALALTTDMPVRSGYTFRGWNTKADGTGTPYASGATYTAEAGATLYAQWDVTAYTVTYRANGGKGFMKKFFVKEGVRYKILDNEFKAPEGKEFKCWMINGRKYNPGDKITIRSDVVISAIWKDKTVAAGSNSNSGLDYVPKTGDSSGIFMWTALMAVSALALGGIVISRKRREK